MLLDTGVLGRDQIRTKLCETSLVVAQRQLLKYLSLETNNADFYAKIQPFCSHTS